MKMHILCLRDIVANVWGQPTFAGNVGAAVRQFGDACVNTQDENNILAKHPEDFEFWEIGEYDDETGIITPFPQEKRRQVAIGANYRKTA